MAPTKFERFITQPVSGDLHDVPGLGKEHGIPTLKNKGIKTTYQLIGRFLKLDRNQEKFCEFLVGCGGIKQHVQETAKAVNQRVTQVGFQCDVKLSDHVIKTSTLFNDTKKTDFLKRKLSGKLSEDFFGINDESAFHKADIKNTDQLFGEFLSIIDEPNPTENTDKCDQFYDFLKKLKASSGHKSVIIYQIQAKLAIGIDTHGPEALKLRPRLLTHREVDDEAMDEMQYDARQNEPPGTGDGTRTRPLSAAAAANKKEQEKKGKSSVPSSKEQEKNEKSSVPSSPYTMPLVVAAFALLGYYFLFGSSSPGPAALPKPRDEGTWL